VSHCKTVHHHQTKSTCITHKRPKHLTHAHTTNKVIIDISQNITHSRQWRSTRPPPSCWSGRCRVYRARGGPVLLLCATRIDLLLPLQYRLSKWGTSRSSWSKGDAAVANLSNRFLRDLYGGNAQAAPQAGCRWTGGSRAGGRLHRHRASLPPRVRAFQN
jgi:hypothetical protein